MNQNYLDILEDSLKKKKEILEKIAELNELQKTSLTGGEEALDNFDSYINQKSEYIEELEKLDEGFETVYAQVSDELKGNKEAYASQIKRMQSLIKEITEKSTSIQAQEARNRELIQNYFGARRNEIKEGRRSSQVAMNYYKMQSNSAYTEATFMDSKN